MQRPDPKPDDVINRKAHLTDKAGNSIADTFSSRKGMERLFLQLDDGLNILLNRTDCGFSGQASSCVSDDFADEIRLQTNSRLLA